MLHNLTEYSSRFRILKGGKISLVVSALLTGATILNATPVCTITTTSTVLTNTNIILGSGAGLTIDSTGGINIDDNSIFSAAYMVYAMNPVQEICPVVNNGTLTINQNNPESTSYGIYVNDTDGTFSTISLRKSIAQV